MSGPHDTVDEIFRRGLRHHQAGQLPQAEALYRQALAINPKHADSLHLLGLIARQVGRVEVAIDLINSAIAIQPKTAEYHNSRGNILRDLGRLQEAEACYREAIRLKGRFPEALCNLGNIHLMLGHPAEAEAYARKAIRLKPEWPAAHTILGHASAALGRLGEAETHYRAALRLNPNSAENLNNLGRALSLRGQHADAERAYREALSLSPDLPETHNNLGGALKELNRAPEAEACFREALRLRPNYAAALTNLSDLLQAIGRAKEAEEYARAAVRLTPNAPDAHNVLGSALRRLGRLAEAEESYRAALALDPNLAKAHSNLGSTLTEVGRFAEAETHLRLAISQNPNFLEAHANLGNLLMAQHRFDEVIPHFEHLLAIDRHFTTVWRGLLGILIYIPDLAPAKSFDTHLAFGRAMAEVATPALPAPTNDKNPDRRLRVGWLSSDFTSHPVGRNLELFFANRDRTAFETVCYADIREADAMTETFRTLADTWRSISGVADAKVAELIRDDRIDIMIYVAGRFDRNRPQVAAWRPAPVQISLFDAATSGLEAMDYFIADRIVVPPHPVEQFTERVLRLPNFYLHSPPIGSPDPGLPPSLSGKPVTFGCFHNPSKLNSRVVALWAEILRQIPKARLRFQYLSRFASEEQCEIIRRYLGPELSDRVEFVSARLSFTEHLALYHEIDVALDPFPFNGATATFEALWMGVPVISLAGDAFMGRWAASMLTKVGLTELIATSPEQYVARAVALATNPARLAELRGSLRDRVRRSSLCDGPRTTRYLERTLRAVWRKWCRDADGGPRTGAA